MSAYRSATTVNPRSRALLCASCGVRLSVSESDLDVECWSCHRLQPVLRADTGFGIAHLRVIERDTRDYHELAAFCSELGLEGRAMSITVDVDGVRCVVSLSLNSGTANGLDLSARTDGLPAMRLLREGGSERHAKETGLSREVQVGDPEFDHAVYIDTEIADADVQATMGSPAVRAAVQELLHAFTTITIDGNNISLSGNQDEPACYRPENIKRQLAALRVLAGAPRPTTLTRVPKGAAASAAQVLSLLLLPAGFGAIVVFGHFFAPLQSATLVFLGIGSGLLVWVLALRVIRRLLSGRSNSHTDVMFSGMTSFVGFPLLSIALLFLVNAALDGSSEREQTGTVTATTFDSEDNETSIEARGKDLEVDFRVPDARRRVKVGDPVTVWSKAGWLGHPWATRRMSVHTSEGIVDER